jgi:hypothetical protein
METEELLPMVMPRVPGCPRMVAAGALLDAARDFARQTHTMRVEIPLSPSDPPRSMYEVTAPRDTELIALAWAEDHAGRPLAAFFTPPKTVGFTQKLTVPAEVVMVVMPLRDAAELPDAFASRWDQAIADGALFRLMSMPSVDWSNAKLADIHMQLFQRAVDEAKGGAARGHTHGSLRVRPRAFV